MFKRNPQFIVHLSSETGIPPIPIFEKRFIVGRKPTHLVAIPDNSISRDHIEIIFQDSQIFVMDLGTSNGTKLDGYRLPTNIPTPYREGQILNLGHSTVNLSIELFSEDREKRKNNPSVKAIQHLDSKAYQKVAPSEPVHSTTTAPIPGASPVIYEEAQESRPLISQGPQTPQVMGAATPASSQPLSVGQPEPLPLATRPVAGANEALGGLVNPQVRDDANRILAKAKIEAEMASRDLLKSKEGEAHALIQKAEVTALQKIKDAEAQVQIILQQAHAEGEKAKQSFIQDAQTEKDRILSTVQTEKDLIQKDIETLKQTLPNLTGQIDQLKLQIQKYQTEKVSHEAQQTQDAIRLEKLHAEIKNQELHLKNIQQQLELNQIKVKEAEEKYQATLLSIQNLIDETKTAHEKAKAREAELADLHESAQRERSEALSFAESHKADAEGFSKALREEADSYVKNLREETESWSHQLRSETETWATKTRESVDLETKQKLEKAHQETEQILSERNRVYEEMKQRQESILAELKDTETLKLKNLDEIDDILRRKSEDFEVAFRSRREGLENEYNARRSQMEREANEKRDALERELSDRRTSIERELLERREALERESAESKSLVERQAQELRAARDKEYKELKAQQDAYLLDIKKREEDRLKNMVEESRRVIREQFHIKNENVQKSFDEFFKDYMRLSPPTLREHLQPLHDQLGKILKDALTNELSGEDKQLRQLLEYDPDIEKKHKRFWIKMAVAASVVIAIFAGFLYDPKGLSKGASAIGDAIIHLEEDSKQRQAKLIEQIKKAGVYRPEKDTLFKSTYTDNILFTTNYLDFEKDDQYRSQWIVATKEFLIQEAKLIDDRADEILSKEGSLVVWLESEIATIDGRNAERGIMRMRERENDYMQELARSLSPELRLALREKKQAFYERFISDPEKLRGPAGKK